ncbi:MAG: GNAT family N-acetyltransferase [Solirubrobacteraceae bacterium]
MLANPGNRDRNLVAVLDGEIVGTITHDVLEDGTGDIGVFVADPWNGTGVGSRLLRTLIAMTENDLQVQIFARNPSRAFYREHRFRESGPEDRHYFTDEVYLPTQVLKLVRDQRPAQRPES